MSAPKDIDPGNRPRTSSKSRTRDEEEISEWLAQNGLKQYADLFIRERISLKSIPYLEESHLKEMGIPVGDRIILKQALKTESPPPDPSIGPSIIEPPPSEDPKPTHKREQSRDLKKSTPVKVASNTKSPSLLVSVPTPPKKVATAAPAQNVEQEEFQCKIVVIGPPAAGKTSLVRRYTQNKFEKGYKQTIGVDFEVKTVQRPENILIHVQLWDIAGQERFSSVVPQFYRSTAAALVVFDVTEESTLQLALKWNEHFQKHEVMTSGRSIPVMLVANKADLLTDDKKPDLEELCKKNGITAWYEISENFLRNRWFTSAKANTGINEAIDYLLDNILNSSGIETKNEKEETVDLSRPKAAKKEEDTCPC